MDTLEEGEILDDRMLCRPAGGATIARCIEPDDGEHKVSLDSSRSPPSERRFAEGQIYNDGSRRKIIRPQIYDRNGQKQGTSGLQRMGLLKGQKAALLMSSTPNLQDVYIDRCNNSNRVLAAAHGSAHTPPIGNYQPPRQTSGPLVHKNQHGCRFNYCAPSRKHTDFEEGEIEEGSDLVEEEVMEASGCVRGGEIWTTRTQLVRRSEAEKALEENHSQDGCRLDPSVFSDVVQDSVLGLMDDIAYGEDEESVSVDIEVDEEENCRHGLLAKLSNVGASLSHDNLALESNIQLWEEQSTRRRQNATVDTDLSVEDSSSDKSNIIYSDYLDEESSCFDSDDDRLAELLTDSGRPASKYHRIRGTKPSSSSKDPKFCSSVVGVSWDAHGKSWRAQFSDKYGRNREKKVFNTEKYGFAQAKSLAEQCRLAACPVVKLEVEELVKETVGRGKRKSATFSSEVAGVRWECSNKSWVAGWTSNIDNKARKNVYSVKLYGFDMAKKLAEEARCQAEMRGEVKIPRSRKKRRPAEFQSGVVGVTWDGTGAKQNWTASWYEKHTNKVAYCSFAVKKFGFNEALALAIQARRTAEARGICCAKPSGRRKRKLGLLGDDGRLNAESHANSVQEHRVQR